MKTLFRIVALLKVGARLHFWAAQVLLFVKWRCPSGIIKRVWKLLAKMFSIQRSALAVELNQLTLARYKLSYYMIEFHLNCVSPIIIKREMMKLIVKKRFDYSSSNSIGIFLTSFGREVESRFTFRC